jgi:peroxiredoxin Q/BCP
MQATDHSLLDTAGRPYRLSQAWANGPAFLIFYPGDETLVCTAQLCSYRDQWSGFTQRGATLVGINPASVERHKRFRERFAFPFPVLADPDGVCCKAYGATAWYGTRRLTVLVDRCGKIRWRQAVLPFLRHKPERLLAELEKIL